MWGYLKNPHRFVSLVILSLEPRKLEENEPKKKHCFQVFDQNMEVIGEERWQAMNPDQNVNNLTKQYITTATFSVFHRDGLTKAKTGL